MTTCHTTKLTIPRGETILYGLRKENRVGYGRQNMPALVLKSLFQPRLIPVIDTIFEIPELFKLVDIVALGENQIHHVIRMAEEASQIPEQVLAELGTTWETLITAILFHDIGKGPEIDDWRFANETVRPKKVPGILRKYNVPDNIEFIYPLHCHVTRSVQIAESYNLDREIIEAIALHHHIKITSQVLAPVAKPLALTSLICSDILHFNPGQYAVPGSKLAQLLGLLDQLCAIERKFRGKVYLSVEPGKLEDEVVKDLIIGVAEKNDPRLNILGFVLNGEESVILLDLSAFGEYVRTHTEYQVQAVKKDVLNTIRSLTRTGGNKRGRDAVGLIGGDEFVIITPTTDQVTMEKMIARVTSAIKARTGLGCRVGYGKGQSIPENFHQARFKANELKTRRS